LDGFFGLKSGNKGMKPGAWNMRSLYRAGSVVTAVNVHAPTEDNIDEEEKWNICLTNSLFTTRKCCQENFTAKVGRVDILKLTTENESLPKISIDNGVRVVYFATFKNLSQKYNIPPIATFINILGYLQMGKPKKRLIMF
jgi:hypothetical protein